MTVHTSTIHKSPSSNGGQELSGEGWLNLHRNENLLLPAGYLASLARSIITDQHLLYYPSLSANELRESIAQHHDVAPENVFVGHGSDAVLAELMGLLRHRFDTVGLQDVGFGGHATLADRFGYQIVSLPGHPFSLMKDKSAEQVKFTVIDSPNGVTGLRIPRETLDMFSAAKDQLLIWDNAYGEYAEDLIPQIAGNRNLVIVRTFSKFYGLAGLRVGYCVAHPELVAELMRRKDPFNVNSIGQAMATCVLQAKSIFAPMVEINRAARLKLEELLCEYGFVCRPSAANFLLVRHASGSAQDIQQRFAERRIAIRAFKQPLLLDSLRITVPHPREFERLREALAE